MVMVAIMIMMMVMMFVGVPFGVVLGVFLAGLNLTDGLINHVHGVLAMAALVVLGMGEIIFRLFQMIDGRIHLLLFSPGS